MLLSEQIGALLRVVGATTGLITAGQEKACGSRGGCGLTFFSAVSAVGGIRAATLCVRTAVCLPSTPVVMRGES